MCVIIRHSYSGDRLFFAAGGWCPAIVHSVPGVWNLKHDSDVFRGNAAFPVRDRGLGTESSEPGCMDSNPVCRNIILRSRIYPADYRTERIESDTGIHADEFGVCIFRAGRLADFAGENGTQTAGRLCIDICRNSVSTDAGG